MSLFQLDVFVKGVVGAAGGDGLRGKLGLVFSGDFEGVEDSGQGWLGADALDWILVEEVVNPWDLGDLVISMVLFVFVKKKKAGVCLRVRSRSNHRSSR